MPLAESVIRAHDELLAAKPAGVAHEDCPVCESRTPGIGITTAKEDEVPEDKARTFTEAEHEAILTEAVRREVASATEAVETEKAELQNRIDVLEAEKAEALQAKETAETELQEFKDSIERDREVAARREARVTAVKEISAASLPDSYFSEERVTRWAEMADEQFEALLDDLAEQAITHLDDKQVTEVAALEGEAKRKRIAEILSEQKGTPEQAGAVTQLVPETAAFSGGKSPAENSEGSMFGKWLGARGRTVPTN